MFQAPIAHYHQVNLLNCLFVFEMIKFTLGIEALRALFFHFYLRQLTPSASDNSEVRAFILALKYSRSPLLFEKIPEIIHLFDGVGAQRLEYLEVLITYLSYVSEESDRGELSNIVKKELELGDDIMKKNSSIWAELGYWAGLEDGEGIGLKKGEVVVFKKGIAHEKQLEKANEKKQLTETLKTRL